MQLKLLIPAFVLLVAYKFRSTHSGQVGMMKVMFGWEKYGKYGEMTAEDIVGEYKFNGKFANTVSVVTGSNTGIGLETARVIGKNGGTVVMACRTPARCEKGKAEIEADVTAGGGTLKCMELDLGSLASVDQFVADFEATGLGLNYLVNNAGIMGLPTFTATVQGIESQWGINHLGHFRLTTGLLPALKKTKGAARVINLSSLAHLWWEPDAVPAPLTAETYNDELAYGTSKAANVMFSLGLRSRLEGTGVLTTAGHPGCIMDTELGRNNPDLIAKFKAMFEKMEAFFGINPMKSLGQGAATTLAMMLDELPTTGTEKLYYADSAPGVVAQGQQNGNYYDTACSNPANAEGLWALSEQYVAAYEKSK